MVKLSKNGITTLKKQYKSVLLKCLAINAGLFMMTVPAMAEDLIVDGNQSIDSTQRFDYGKIVVNQGAKLTITNSDIKTTAKNIASDDIVVKGQLELTDSVFEAGSDYDTAPNNSNMLFDGVTVNSTDSDIEANGNVTIKSSNVSLFSTNPTLDSEGSGVKIDDGTFGIWADNNVSITDSKINVKDSYIAGEKNISISGNATDMTIDRGSVKSVSGDITISGGKINVENNGEIKAHHGNLSLSGGEITVNNGEVDGLNAEISGTTKINVANGWFGADEVLTVSGGEINLSQEGVLGASPLDDNIGTGLVKITGGTINMENSYLVAEADHDGAGNFQMSGGTINLTSGSSIYGIVDISGGTINMTDSDIEADGNMIIKNSIIKSSSTDELNHDNSDIHGIWADGNIELGGENNFELNNSYIAADGDLVITGGNYKSTSKEDSQFIAKSITIKDGYERNIDFVTKVINIEGGSSGALRDKFESRVIELGDDDDYFNQKGGNSVFVNEMADGMGHVNVSGGKLDLTTSEFDSLYVNISGGEVNLKGTEEVETNLYARKNYDITGGTINMDGYAVMDNIADIETDKYDKFALNISGGTINVNGQKNEISSSKEINFTGGTITINEGAELGMFGGNESAPTTVNFGKNAVYNVGGILSTNISGNGQINITGSQAYLSGNVNMTDGGVMNIDANQALAEGNVTFAKGSTLKMAITDDANGQLKANSIVAEKDSTLSLNITKTMQKDETASFKLFDAKTIDNNFTNVVQNARYEISTEDGANYNVTYIASASDIVDEAGGSANNAATAEAWDSLSGQADVSETTKAVANALSELSQSNPQAYVDALTALAPETAPAATQTATDTAGAVFNAVGSRLSGGSVAGNQGMSSGDALNGVALWIQGMFNHAKFDGNKHSKGFDSDTWGTALGIEKQINKSVKAGVGYAYSKTDIDGFMRDTDVKTHTAILYGEYKPSNWYANAVVSYGWSDYEEKKNVAGVGVKADWDVESFAVQAMTGYQMNVDGFGITPETGLRYVHVKQDGYKDSAGQKVSGNNSDILTGVLGAKVAKSWALENGMVVTPEIKAAMTYDMKNDKGGSVVTLANGSTYAVSGKALDRFGIELSAGITMEVNDNVELSLGYEGKFRDDYADHTGLINAKYKF